MERSQSRKMSRFLQQQREVQERKNYTAKGVDLQNGGRHVKII